MFQAIYFNDVKKIVNEKKIIKIPKNATYCFRKLKLFGNN